MRPLPLLLLLPMLAMGVFAAHAAEPSPPPSPTKAEIVPALQAGGYILFIRHPQTNADQADIDPLHLDNVKDQRQLSDEGRAQAKALGAALRALKIPIGKVWASKFYRAQEAATLLDLGDVEASLDITEGGLVVTPKENQRRAAALGKLLAMPPAAGKNTIIVSHKPNLQDAAGKQFGDATEGEVVIFQPAPDGTFKLIARIAPVDRWTEWTK